MRPAFASGFAGPSYGRGASRLLAGAGVILLAALVGALALLALTPGSAAGQADPTGAMGAAGVPEGSPIRLRRALVMVVGVDRQAGVVRVMEKLALHNAAEQPYQPPRWQDSVIRLALPPAARELALEAGPTGAELLPLGAGQYTLAAPLPVGDQGVVISYVLPYAGEGGGTTLKVERGTGMPAETYQVMAPALEGMALRPVGRALTPKGELAIGDQRYAVLEGSGVSAGADASFELRGLPARGGGGGGGGAIGGAGGLAGVPGGQLAEPPLVVTAALLLGAALVYGAVQR